MSELVQVIVVTLIAAAALAGLLRSYWKPAKPSSGSGPAPCAHCPTQAAHARTVARSARAAVPPPR